MKNINKITFLFILLLGFACNDDFLERLPSDQVSADTFFEQEKDLEYALNGIYNELLTDMWWTDELLLSDILTDNAADHHSWDSGYDLSLGVASTQDGWVLSQWRWHYRGIQRANRLIEGAEKVKDINADLKARYVAEAKFLRAFFYQELTYLFGDVPFLTSPTTPDEALKATRTDTDIILSALADELSEVAPNLPITHSGADVGRATKGAALALKTRILLYQERYPEAAAAAKEVIDLGVYTLHPSYKELFTYAGINSSEVIFDRQAKKGDEDGQNNVNKVIFGPNSVGGWSVSCPLQSLVDTYETIDGKTIDDPTSIYDPAKPYDNRDPRLTHSILYPGSDWQGGVYNTIPGATYEGREIIPGDDLNDGTGGQWNKTSTGYNWLKYIPVEDDNAWDGAIHHIIIRYADVLLMYAEAKIEANDIDQSVYDAINLVRGRADVNMPPIAMGKSQSELREILRRERRVELAFESLRLFDIRRWRIAHEVMPGEAAGLTYTNEDGSTTTLSAGTRIFNEKDYLWPIPQAEIDISGLEQNTGW